MQKTNYEQKSFAFLNQKDERYKDEEWLKKQARKRLTQKEIGAKCGVGDSIVSVWMRKFDIKPARGRKSHEEFTKEVEELVGAEYTVLENYQDRITKLLMRHNKCGYQYKVTPSAFLHGNNCCPVCSHSKLIDTEAFKKRVYEKVGMEYTVLGEYKGTNSKILMQHEKCGYEWRTTPHTFLEGHRCPKCNHRSYKRTQSEFENEVKELVGDEYKILSQYKKEDKKIKIKHNCGYIYETIPANFLRGVGRCPVCSCSHSIDTEVFRKKVEKKVGKEYTVLGDYRRSDEKILMRHEKCGHEYKIIPSSFLQGRRCSHCASSKGEKQVEVILKKVNLGFETEVTFTGCKRKRKLQFDFGIKNDDEKTLALIEFDGVQHYKPIDFWDSYEEWRERVERDHLKDRFALENDIPLLRVNYMDKEAGELGERVKSFLRKNGILN